MVDLFQATRTVKGPGVFKEATIPALFEQHSLRGPRQGLKIQRDSPVLKVLSAVGENASTQLLCYVFYKKPLVVWEVSGKASWRWC